MQLLSPVDNELKYNYLNFRIELTEVAELCQGCPETGKLLINDVPFDDSFRFGTNILFKDHFILLPLYNRGWLKTGFKLASINLYDKKLAILSDIENLVMPYKIADQQVHYFTDLANQDSKSSTLLT